MITENIDRLVLTHNWTEINLDWIAKYGKDFYDDIEYKLAISEDGDIIILVRLK